MVDLDRITQAKTATEAVEALKEILEAGGAPALLSDERASQTARQAIHDLDQRRDTGAEGILNLIPRELHPLAMRKLIPATCQV